MEKVRAYRALFDALAAIPESTGLIGAIFDQLDAAFREGTPRAFARRHAVRRICDAYTAGVDCLTLSIPADAAAEYIEMLKFFGVRKFRCSAGADLLTAFAELGVSYNNAECVFTIKGN